MGLFNDAGFKYGGKFYRSFSQAHGEKDLEIYFHDDPVVQQGVCAGSSLAWIQHYLTLPDSTQASSELYSNEIMSKDRTKITTIQRGLRYRDQSLTNLLLLYGLKPQEALPFKNKIENNNIEEAAIMSTAVSSIGVISYEDPKQGKHVAVFYVDKNKNLFFMDTHKGDVLVPYPNSSKWLARYMDIFTKKCGHIEISHFKPKWNDQQARQAFRSIANSSLNYNPLEFGIKGKRRIVDDQAFDYPRIPNKPKP